MECRLAHKGCPPVYAISLTASGHAQDDFSAHVVGFAERVSFGGFRQRKHTFDVRLKLAGIDQGCDFRQLRGVGLDEDPRRANAVRFGVFLRGLAEDSNQNSAFFEHAPGASARLAR